MDASKIRNIFDLEWLQLSIDTARMFALVPRGSTNNAEAHGYICETASNSWRCAGIEADGSMAELGIQPRRIDARQVVQKQVIRAQKELADIHEKNTLLNGVEGDAETVAGI